MAGVEYGRIDYAMKDGAMQVWEINLNATLLTPVAREVAALAEAGHDVTGVHLALSRNPQTYRSGARGCYAGTAPPIVVRCIKRRWGMS